MTCPDNPPAACQEDLTDGQTLVPVELDSLTGTRLRDFELFLGTEHGFSLYRARHTPITAEDCRRLAANGIGRLFIRDSDRDAYRRYLLDQLQDTVTDDDLPLRQRCQAAHHCARTLAEELIADTGRIALYEDAAAMVRSTVALVMCYPDAVTGLASMLKHDYYTSTHLINVSTLALILATRLGIDDEEQLRMIGAGGLLHDIGKTRIDPAVLNCRHRLTDAQFAELRRHPDYGMHIMMEMETLSVGRPVLRMVHQHHERLDGSGYPMGLVGEEISLCARICAVVDVYDAMTCKRPYRDALPVQAALEHLAELAGGQLDGDMARLWIEAAPGLTRQQLAWDRQGEAAAAVAAAVEPDCPLPEDA